MQRGRASGNDRTGNPAAALWRTDLNCWITGGTDQPLIIAGRFGWNLGQG